MNKGRNRKLKENQVVLIRQMKREGFGRRYLAKVFGLSEHGVGLVTRRVTYKEGR